MRRCRQSGVVKLSLVRSGRQITELIDKDGKGGLCQGK